jgi:iron complex transport system ATP-binding protein
MLARAIVAESNILILDEPTSALDMKNQSLILEWMNSLNKNNRLTIVFTTHNPLHAINIADNVLLMFNKFEYCFGSTLETLSEENMFKLYGLPIKKVVFEHKGRRVVSCVPVFKITDRDDDNGPLL